MMMMEGGMEKATPIAFPRPKLVTSKFQCSRLKGRCAVQIDGLGQKCPSQTFYYILSPSHLTLCNSKIALYINFRLHFLALHKISQ